MNRLIRGFVHAVDASNLFIGRAVMYLVLAMIGILLYAAIARTVSAPSLWFLEMAQFVMVAYYLLGGGYSMQLDAHVRMDLLYGRWSERTKMKVDCVTGLLMIFYLLILLYGGYSSSEYALEYGERSYSSWRPYMAPIKIIMVIGILLMLLQVIADWLKDLAKLLGRPIA